MTFELSPEHQQFRRTVRDFAEKEIAPNIAQWDRDHHFPVDVVKKMGDLGLFGLTAPEEYGGADGDFTSLCVAPANSNPSVVSLAPRQPSACWSCCFPTRWRKPTAPMSSTPGN